MSTLMLTPADSFVRIFTVTDDDGVSPLNLAGCTVWFAAKLRASSDTYAAYCYWESGGASQGITVATPATGVCVVTLTPEQTAAFVHSAHVWDLQVETPDGTIRTIDRGTLVVLTAVNDRVVAP